ncbi:MAG TPA: hypothetical protein VES94_06815 [Burkholderiales bacterium]|nr:hypothetical protein [Burkholderiales bacterium]
MFTGLKQTLERRLAIRADGAELVQAFGARGADIAMQRAQGHGLTDEQRHHWREVAAFAHRWDEQLEGLDTWTRCVSAQRYLRRA